jgi:predicted 3-demethylubiquinone-9 3-methyltransferase (glyoxalase superfamily)
MQKIVPFLWFDDNAEEAIAFYTGIFKDSQVKDVRRYGKGGPGPFFLNGQEFYALNGGPMFKFTEAISLFVKCETQDEIDYYWDKLSAGGSESRCGWLKDKFGLSWQIVPPILGELLGDKDPKKANNVMQAMLKMGKLDISLLEEAYNK